MSEEERLKKENELRMAWYEMRKRAEPSPTMEKPATETPLDLKTKRPHTKWEQSTNNYDNKRIRILEDKIIQNVPFTYVPPNVYIENNYYEPISPPETNDNNEDNTATDTSTGPIHTVQDDIAEVEKYHVVTHDQYLEYLTLKGHFENAQDEATEGTQDTTEPEIECNDTHNIPSAREKTIQALIGMSDEYKNQILSVLNKVKTSDISRNIMMVSLLAKFRMNQEQKSLELIKKMGEQRVNVAIATNPGRDDVYIVDDQMNAIPANIPNEVHNYPIINVENEWQSRMMRADLNEMNRPNVPYISQAPRKESLQNVQPYTVVRSDQQQFLPHAYSQQQSCPNTFVPSAQSPGPATESDRQQVYSTPDITNFPQQRWNSPVFPVNKHPTYIQKVIPSGQIQAYPKNEIKPVILIRPQKVPSPVILSGQQHIEQHIPGSRIRYPGQILVNNQQQIIADPNEIGNQYSELAILNYQPQRYNESVTPSHPQQSYHEGIVSNNQQKCSERVSRRSRQQRQYLDQLTSSQQQSYSDGVSPNMEHIRYPDPYVTQNQQQLQSEQIEKRSLQQRYHGLVSPQNPQRHPIPVIPSSQQSRYYDPNSVSSQPYRHPIPPASQVQQQEYIQTAASSKKPKRQYHRRKDTAQRQHPASVRWQQIHSSPSIQPYPQQNTVPSQIIRRTMQAPVPEVPNQPIPPISDQVPEYYQQYYNQHHENQHTYRDPNYYHP